MKYREMLFFISKCLSLKVHPERVEEIRGILKDDNFSWEKLVWVSSNQMILPALYVRFREADLLSVLPEDLVAHMENLHRVNAKRNKIILRQIEEIVDLLNKHSIHPIFLKGTAHLLEGLYVDDGERMIGDIDIMLPLDQILPSVELLEELGYSNPKGMNMETLMKFRHYPRLRSEKVVAAIEIHRQLVHKPYNKKFNLELLNPEKKKLPGNGTIYVLSDNHQIIHNIMHGQMNDTGYSARKIFLRQVYDLMLLSGKADPLKAVNQFGSYSRHLNSNLIVSARMLNNPDSMTYKDSKFARRYFRQTIYFIDHPKTHKLYRMLAYLGSFVERYYLAFYHAFTNKKERRALMKNMVNRAWLKQHFSSYRQIWNV